jgi:hypothetical protein
MRLDRSKDMSVHISTCTSYDFQRIIASSVEVVALIRRECFCLVAKASEIRKECKKLSVKMEDGGINMIPEANDKSCDGNSRHPHDPRKFACRNHK